MLRGRHSVVGAVVAAGVVAAGAGVWCCGGSGSVPPDAPEGSADDPSGGAAGVTAAVVDPAVVGSGAEPPPRGPDSQDSDAGACTSGEVWLTVRIVALGGGETAKDLVVREGGAYTDKSGSGVVRGCLTDAERSQIQAALEVADFTPPPPPEVQCMAVPTREVTVEHPATGRSATFSSPCGKPVHPSIAGLFRLLSDVGTTAGSEPPR